MPLIHLTTPHTRIQRGQSDTSAAWTGWAVIINPQSKLNEAELQRRLGPDEVLPLILSSEGSPLTETLRKILADCAKPILFAGQVTPEDRASLGEQVTLIEGLQPAQSRQVRDGDWLVATPLSENEAQVLALRDVRSPWFEVEEVVQGVYTLTEPGHQEWVRSFLVLGQREAALIDTGMGIDNIRPIVESLTDLPIRVILTHSHWDHIGSVGQFEQVAIHPAEKESLAQGAPLGSERLQSLQSQLRRKCFGRPWPPYFDPARYELPGYPDAETIEEGDEIDLGGRVLRVLHTPGHSLGSISLLDTAHRHLYIGDTFYYGPLYCEDFETYLATARRLAHLADQVDLVFSSHNELALNGRPMSGQDLIALRDGFERIAAKKIANQSLAEYHIPEGHFSVLSGFPY